MVEKIPENEAHFLALSVPKERRVASRRIEVSGENSMSGSNSDSVAQFSWGDQRGCGLTLLFCLATSTALGARSMPVTLSQQVARKSKSYAAPHPGTSARLPAGTLSASALSTGVTPPRSQPVCLSSHLFCQFVSCQLMPPLLLPPEADNRVGALPRRTCFSQTARLAAPGADLVANVACKRCSAGSIGRARYSRSVCRSRDHHAHVCLHKLKYGDREPPSSVLQQRQRRREQQAADEGRRRLHTGALSSAKGRIAWKEGVALQRAG